MESAIQWDRIMPESMGGQPTEEPKDTIDNKPAPTASTTPTAPTELINANEPAAARQSMESVPPSPRCGAAEDSNAGDPAAARPNSAENDVVEGSDEKTNSSSVDEATEAAPCRNNEWTAEHDAQASGRDDTSLSETTGGDKGIADRGSKVPADSEAVADQHAGRTEEDCEEGAQRGNAASEEKAGDSEPSKSGNDDVDCDADAPNAGDELAAELGVSDNRNEEANEEDANEEDANNDVPDWGAIDFEAVARDASVIQAGLHEEEAAAPAMDVKNAFENTTHPVNVAPVAPTRCHLRQTNGPRLDTSVLLLPTRGDAKLELQIGRQLGYRLVMVRAPGKVPRGGLPVFPLANKPVVIGRADKTGAKSASSDIALPDTAGIVSRKHCRITQA